MMDKLKRNAHSISAFSVIFYTVTLFLTLDTYCKNRVTPETPLLNIAGLPFLRMDFVLIIFTAAFLIGTAIVYLLKKSAPFLLPFALGVAGLLSLFIALFDVNTMQLFDPTMRISHVIMTVSRVLAIVAGVSGGFIGAACTILCRQKISAKSAVLSAGAAIILSLLANAENLQNQLFAFCAVLLLFGSAVCDFSKEKICLESKAKRAAPKTAICAFLSAVSFTALAGSIYAVLCENAGFSALTCTVFSGIVCIAFCAVLTVGYRAVLSPAAMFTGSVLSYVLVHYGSRVVTYSGNRVIYIMPYWVGSVLLAVSAVTAVLLFRQKKKEQL